MSSRPQYSLTMSNYRDYYSQLRQEGRLHGTIARAMEIRKSRKTAAETDEHDGRPYPRNLSHPLTWRTTVIPLGRQTTTRINAEAKHLRPRVINWIDAEADTSSRGVSVAEIDCGRYPGMKWSRYEYSARLRSCGVCSPRWLQFYFGAQSTRIKSPRGWRFGVDELGIFIVRARENRESFRFHFDSDDLGRRPSPKGLFGSARQLRAAAIKHEKRQLERAHEQRNFARKAKARAETISSGYVFVGIRDSREAGNCSAGTRTWATRHGLSANRHYPVNVIRRAGGDNPQVDRAIQAAADRTIEDMQRGYCILGG